MPFRLPLRSPVTTGSSRARSRVRLAALLLVAIAAVVAPAIAQQPPAPPAGAPAAPVQASPPAAPGAAPQAQGQAPAPAPVAPLPKEVDETIRSVLGVMENAEKSLERMKVLDDDIGRLRNDVEGVISRTTREADALRPKLAAVQSQIQKLGPPPTAGQAPEAANVAGERQRLAAESTALDGAIKTLELTWVRARQTIDKITDLRLALFTRSITQRMSSPLLPKMWSDLARDAPQVGWLVNYVGTDWVNAAWKQPTAVGLLGLVAAGLYFGLRRLAQRLARLRLDRSHAPNFFDRALMAAWLAPLRAMPAVVTALALYGGLDALGMLYYPSDQIANAVLRGFLVFTGIANLVDAVHAPGEPDHRIVDLSDKSARRIGLILKAITAVYAVDLALSAIGRTLYLPLSMSVFQTVVATLVFAGLIVALALTPFETARRGGAGEAASAPSVLPAGAAELAEAGLSDAVQGLTGQVSRHTPVWLKLPLWTLALFILVTTALGYVALGRFVAQQVLLTGVVVMIGALLFLAIRAFTRDQNGESHAVGEILEKRFGLDGGRRAQLAWLTEVVLTLLLFILGLPLLLLQWGFSDAEIRDWSKAALFGFEVGQFKISLVRILIGILLFIGLLFATRMLQRWLRDQVLGSSRMDSGVINSIDTAVGYAGIALAALLAISYAGFDVTSLAIVAGALSVGIGFGLQSIVNNFVSGLILLIERPIKVGDWIVVGNEQGNVRKISVRSTEIETFDKASLIVPNSELITGRVLNWTHRNAMGRVVVKLQTSQDEDPVRVREIMLKCALEHPSVLNAPEPAATLDGFSAGLLDFTLRVHVANVYGGGGVGSDLRIALLAALKAANISSLAAAAPAAASTLVAKT